MMPTNLRLRCVQCGDVIDHSCRDKSALCYACRPTLHWWIVGWCVAAWAILTLVVCCVIWWTTLDQLEKTPPPSTLDELRAFDSEL